jgi:hypothetical protein
MHISLITLRYYAEYKSTFRRSQTDLKTTDRRRPWFRPNSGLGVAVFNGLSEELLSYLGVPYFERRGTIHKSKALSMKDIISYLLFQTCLETDDTLSSL